MTVEKSYDAVLGNNYWIDVWYQGALPEGVKEIKMCIRDSLKIDYQLIVFAQ